MTKSKKQQKAPR